MRHVSWPQSCAAQCTFFVRDRHHKCIHTDGRDDGNVISLEWLMMVGRAQEWGHSPQTLGLCETKAFLYPCCIGFREEQGPDSKEKSLLEYWLEKLLEFWLEILYRRSAKEKKLRTAKPYKMTASWPGRHQSLSLTLHLTIKWQHEKVTNTIKWQINCPKKIDKLWRVTYELSQSNNCKSQWPV